MTLEVSTNFSSFTKGKIELPSTGQGFEFCVGVTVGLCPFKQRALQVSLRALGFMVKERERENPVWHTTERG